MADRGSLRYRNGSADPQLQNSVYHYLSCCSLLNHLLCLRQLKDLSRLQRESPAWVPFRTPKLQIDNCQRPFAHDNSVACFPHHSVLDAVTTICPRYWEVHGRKTTSTAKWFFEEPKKCHHYVQSFWRICETREPVKYRKLAGSWCTDGQHPFLKYGSQENFELWTQQFIGSTHWFPNIWRYLLAEV